MRIVVRIQTEGQNPAETRLFLKLVLEKPSPGPIFPLNLRRLFQKLKFWNSLAYINGFFISTPLITCPLFKTSDSIIGGDLQSMLTDHTYP
jgi:hypothetical protein